MNRPLILIIGGTPTGDADALEVASPELAAAAEEIGNALAKKSCRLLVYSGFLKYVDPYVVTGYVRAQQTVSLPAGSIEIHYAVDEGYEKTSYP